jgi:xylulose-5-phosphate/fructose-6-phosphate phosphoketolase
MTAMTKIESSTLGPELLRKLDAYWRAANYLSVGQIYLYDNPLLKRPLTIADVKRMLLGHWGTTPGQNFIYVHLNRIIKKYDLDMIYVSGPGHGGPAVVGNTYLEGTYSEIYPDISQDEAGLRKLFIQFSFPGGIPSHASPECPGSIHEGGELGYSLSHSFGAVFDNPDLVDDASDPAAVQRGVREDYAQCHSVCPAPRLHRGRGLRSHRAWAHKALRTDRRRAA